VVDDKDEDTMEVCSNDDSKLISVIDIVWKVLANNTDDDDIDDGDDNNDGVDVDDDFEQDMDEENDEDGDKTEDECAIDDINVKEDTAPDEEDDA
jgi:hypothetical protein